MKLERWRSDSGGVECAFVFDALGVVLGSGSSAGGHHQGPVGAGVVRWWEVRGGAGCGVRFGRWCRGGGGDE